MKKVLLLRFVALFILVSFPACGQEQLSPWSRVDSILQRVKEPSFPSQDYLLTDFGAKGDGSTDCSRAFANAIGQCSRAGGGRVVVPRGLFITGPITLRSNTELYLSDSAVIRFSTDPSQYLPPVFTRWEGVECMNYSPLIYAFESENIAITGRGTLDGGGSDTSWWPWKGREEFGWKEGMPNQLQARGKLFKMGETGVPVKERIFGEGSCLRPNFIQPYKCRNILIEDVKIINSPMWEIHPVLSENIIIRNVTIDSRGPNNDGCDPECSRDVLIENCSFNTGDDCIAIKSGRNNDGRRVNVPSENIVIRNCRFADGHGGVTIGSEISGGARNIFAENCRFESPILYNALRLKSNAVRGGVIENLFLRNMNVVLVDKAAFEVDLQYEEGEKGNYLPTIRNIAIDSMFVDKCAMPLNLVGYAGDHLRNIRITNSDFRQALHESVIRFTDSLQVVNSTVNGKKFNPR